MAADLEEKEYTGPPAGATLVALIVGVDWQAKPIGEVVELFASHSWVEVNPLEHAYFLRVWRQEMCRMRKKDGSTLDDVVGRMYGGWSQHAFNVAASACGGVLYRLEHEKRAPMTIASTNGHGPLRGHVLAGAWAEE